MGLRFTKTVLILRNKGDWLQWQKMHLFCKGPTHVTWTCWILWRKSTFENQLLKSALNEYGKLKDQFFFRTGFAIFVFPTQHLRLVTTVFWLQLGPAVVSTLKEQRDVNVQNVPKVDQKPIEIVSFTRKCWIWGFDFSPFWWSLRKLGDERSWCSVSPFFFPSDLLRCS